MQTRALVDFGDLNLNHSMQLYGPVGDLAVYRGRYYPSKAPLMSFVAVPVYVGLRAFFGTTPRAVPELALVYFSRLFLTVLPTLLLLVWIRRYLRTFVSAASADVVTITYALGTLAFSYSLLFMSHQPTAVLLFSSFYGLWRWSRREWSNSLLILCGAFAGAGVAAEYTSALGVFALCCYGVLLLVYRGNLCVSLGASALFVLGALPAVLLLGWYHATVFGGPFETGYRHLADAAYQPWHQGGLFGIGLPNPRSLALSLFSPLRGFFILSPILLLGVYGIRRLFRISKGNAELRPVAWFTLILVLGYGYFTAGFSYESWGWTTGPRHLTALVPFLLLPLSLVIDGARGTWLSMPCAALCVSSVIVTSALTFINYIPDDVSNALSGLAVPLTRTGFMVPSMLCVLGLPNPVAGGLLWLGVLAVCGWISRAMWADGLFGWGAAVAVLATTIAFSALTYRDSPSDRGALALLRRVWLAPPGHVLAFTGPLQ